MLPGQSCHGASASEKLSARGMCDSTCSSNCMQQPSSGHTRVPWKISTVNCTATTPSKAMHLEDLSFLKQLASIWVVRLKLMVP